MASCTAVRFIATYSGGHHCGGDACKIHVTAAPTALFPLCPDIQFFGRGFTLEFCYDSGFKKTRMMQLLLIGMDVKLDFFSKSKLESKKSIKTRNSFPVVS